MHPILLDVNPIIAAGGQIAAIILCISLLITVLLMLAVNLGLAFLLGLLREKVSLIKQLRPTVDSVNKSSEAALQGRTSDDSNNKVARTVASLPGGVHTVDQKVEQISGKVANVAIEVHARTIQVKTIVQAFLAPRTIRERNGTDKAHLDTNETVERVAEASLASSTNGAASPDGAKQASSARQERHVSTR